jgi:hypothetical protein
MTQGRDVDICNRCGEDESARDELGLSPIGPDEWPVRHLSVTARLYAEPRVADLAELNGLSDGP